MLDFKPLSLPLESSVFIPLDSEANTAPQQWFPRKRAPCHTSDEGERKVASL